MHCQPKFYKLKLIEKLVVQKDVPATGACNVPDWMLIQNKRVIDLTFVLRKIQKTWRSTSHHRQDLQKEKGNRE